MLQTGLIENPGVPHKSIDFRIPIPNTQNHIYISHKHTDLDGGAQNQALADLNHFIGQSNLSNFNDTPNCFVAIADGNFYENPQGQQNLTRLQILANYANQNYTFATNMYGFRAIYNMILQRANPQ
jgi:hypothetical protein